MSLSVESPPGINVLEDLPDAIIALTFAQAMDITSTPAGSDFAVRFDDVDIGVPDSVAWYNNTVLELTYLSQPMPGINAEVDYTSGVNPIRTVDRFNASNWLDLTWT